MDHPSKYKKLQVGIVGCGYQGGRLAEAIALTGTMAVAACTDIDPAAAASLAASVGHAAVFASTDELLASPGVEVVMVATPHDILAGISLRALRAGKHVLCEKPIGLTQEEVIPVEEEVARSGLSYMAGYSFRYIPAWQRVRELLAQGVIGELVTITGTFGLGPMSNGWLADPVTGGGPLYYVGSHLIDQILWYVDEDAVEVWTDIRYRADNGADETSAFTIRFAGGATAQCTVTQAVNGMCYNLQIYGRRGRIDVRPAGFLDYDIQVVSDVVAEYNTGAVLHPGGEGDPRNVMHRAQLEDFASAIASHSQPPITVGDGRRVLQIIDAIFASARGSAAVRILP